mmetsp:Transcript_17448/g.43435  ORF Transcript_17448/g.43435 Transcript_17448/m.43435 type:complete len:137 (+) Transcript_17448:2426-2836(+)
MLAVRLREQENCTTTGRLYLSTEEEIDYSSLTAPGEQPLPRTVTYHMGMHPDTKVKHVFNATRSSDASSLLFHSRLIVPQLTIPQPTIPQLTPPAPIPPLTPILSNIGRLGESVQARHRWGAGVTPAHYLPHRYQT